MLKRFKVDNKENNENVLKLSADIYSFLPNVISNKGLIDFFNSNWIKYKKIVPVKADTETSAKNAQLNYFNNCFFPAIVEKIETSVKINYIVKTKNSIENFNVFGIKQNAHKYENCPILEVIYLYTFNLEHTFNNGDVGIINYFSSAFSYVPSIESGTMVVADYESIEECYNLNIDTVIEKNKVNCVFYNKQYVPNAIKIGRIENEKAIKSATEFAIENFKQELLAILNKNLFDYFMEISASAHSLPGYEDYSAR